MSVKIARRISCVGEELKIYVFRARKAFDACVREVQFGGHTLTLIHPYVLRTYNTTYSKIKSVVRQGQLVSSGYCFNSNTKYR